MHLIGEYQKEKYISSYYLRIEIRYVRKKTDKKRDSYLFFLSAYSIVISVLT